jgi:hypothetical protein
VLVGALGAPDDSCGGAGGVETGVGFVAFVRVAELAMDLGVRFCGGRGCQFMCERRVCKQRMEKCIAFLPWTCGFSPPNVRLYFENRRCILALLVLGFLSAFLRL